GRAQIKGAGGGHSRSPSLAGTPVPIEIAVGCHVARSGLILDRHRVSDLSEAGAGDAAWRRCALRPASTPGALPRHPLPRQGPPLRPPALKPQPLPRPLTPQGLRLRLLRTPAPHSLPWLTPLSMAPP